MISPRSVFTARLLPLCMALVFVPFGVAAAEEEKRKRGLKRLIPSFKKESKEAEKASDEAIEDMREFTASLPGAEASQKVEPVVPQVVPPVAKPKPDSEKVEPTPPSPPELAPAPEAKEKKGRFGFFRRAFGGDEKASAEAKAAQPTEAQQQASTPAPEQKAEVKEVADGGATGRRKLIKIPFIGGRGGEVESKTAEMAEGDKPAPAEDAEANSEISSENEIEKKTKRARLSILPFVGEKVDKEKMAATPENIEPEAVADGETKKGKGFGLPKLRLPFGKGEGEIEKEVEIEEEQVAVVEAPEKEKAPKREKRGLFGLRRGLDEKIPALEPTSSRDLGTGEKYIVAVVGTPFYSIGPSQPLPPDEILNKGKLVTMRKAGWGWSDIELPGGQLGVVATKNLRKATAAEMGGSYASRGAGRSSSRGLFKSMGYDPVPEPELPTDAGGIPLGVGLLPPLNPDD